MKISVALMLTCISALAAETNDVRVVTRTDTHTQPGILITIDQFTRAGQTNLVCDTRTQDGALRMRTHRFYHNGSLVGEYSTNTLYSYHRHSIVSIAGAPYSLGFSFDASNNVTATIVSNTVAVESFNCTNGIFYPADSAYLAKLNGVMKDVITK